jgi:FeS assembly SUF system regulator
MTHLARSSGQGTHTTRDVAARTYLPLPMVSKILKALVRGGLLESQRGVNGGYSLARCPEEVSVADIITALEGPIGMTECTGEEADPCTLEHTCAVRSNWQLVNEVVRRALENITLDHMAAPMPCTFDNVLAAPPQGEPLPGLSAATQK